MGSNRGRVWGTLVVQRCVLCIYLTHKVNNIESMRSKLPAVKFKNMPVKKGCMEYGRDPTKTNGKSDIIEIGTLYA